MFIEKYLFMASVRCSLNWQHQVCKNPRPNPDIKTLFVDHTCGPPNGTRALSPVTTPLMNSVLQRPAAFPLGPHPVSKVVEYLNI